MRDVLGFINVLTIYNMLHILSQNAPQVNRKIGNPRRNLSDSELALQAGNEQIGIQFHRILRID